MRRTRVLRQLIADSMYMIDDRLVAEAIVTRMRARVISPGISFGNEPNSSAVRSFRLEHEARSFRLGSRPHARR
jgi:hypothetical protein